MKHLAPRSRTARTARVPRITRALATALATLAALCISTSLHAQPARPPAPAAPAAPAASEGAEVLELDTRPWSEGVALADRHAARELFLEGNRLFRVPLFARAAVHYQAALDKWKHPAFSYNLALAQMNLGQEVEARNNLELAMRHGAEPLGAVEYEEAEKQLRHLEQQLGRVVIHCPTDGAEVTLDGVILFTGPGRYEGWVTAGAHELTAKKRDYLSEARRLEVAGGKVAEADLRLITLDEAAGRNRRWTVWKPWAVVAAGTAVMLGGGVFHSLSAKNFSDYDDAFLRLPCVTGDGALGCTRADIGPTLNDQLDTARQQQRLAIGAYAVGGALLATGAVLLYLNRSRVPEGEAPRLSTPRISLLPELSPNAAGVVLSVRH